MITSGSEMFLIPTAVEIILRFDTAGYFLKMYLQIIARLRPLISLGERSMAGIWGAVQQVTGFFSLVAFLAAAVLLYHRHRLAHETRRLEALPPDQRARAFDALLARFHVETSVLTKAQQHELALAQLHSEERKARHRFWLALIASLLVAMLWGLSMIVHANGDKGAAGRSGAQASGLSREQFDSLTRLIAAGASRGDSRERKALLSKVAGKVRGEVLQVTNTGVAQVLPARFGLPPGTFLSGNEGRVWWSDPSVPPYPSIRGQFRSGVAWLNIIHDQRDSSSSRVEVDFLRLYAHVNGKTVLIASDEYEGGSATGALFERIPWFGGASRPIAGHVTFERGRLVIPASSEPGRVWHIWNHAYPRLVFPEGTTRVWAETRFRIIGAALLQLGFDYYRGATDIGCDIDLNGIPEPGYCEAGTSTWISSSSDEWQTLTLGN